MCATEWTASVHISHMSKAWQWHFVHRNDNVAHITAQTLRKWCDDKNTHAARPAIESSRCVCTPLRFRYRFFRSVQDKIHCSLWKKNWFFLQLSIAGRSWFNKNGKLIDKKHWIILCFHVLTTRLDLQKTLKSFPGFWAVRLFLKREHVEPSETDFLGIP